jgi:hypothetical protein
MTPIVKRLALALATFALALVAGCGGDKGSEADPPADFRVQAGDGSAIVTWTAEPDTEYWLFFGLGPDITVDNWAPRGGVAITNATSPRIITGLTNGVTYSFTINARKNKGPGGDGAPSQNIVPMIAGENWAPAAALGTQNLNAIAGGTLPNGFDVVAVGNAGAIYSGIATGPFVARTSPAAENLYGTAYGLAGFVAVGANGTILTSQNAIDWARSTSGTTARLTAAISSSTAVYVAVGDAGAVATSTDGLQSWTTPSSTVLANLYGVTWGNNRFVAVGAAGTIITGSGGTDWVQVVEGISPNTLRAAAYGAFFVSGSTAATNVYLAVGDAGTVVKSENGTDWSVVPPFTTRNLLAVTYGGRFVAVGDDGSIFTSSDGVTWAMQNSNTTADLFGVARTISGYTAVGEAGTNVSTF